MTRTREKAQGKLRKAANQTLGAINSRGEQATMDQTDEANWIKSAAAAVVSSSVAG